MDSQLTPAEQWEILKSITATTAKSFSRHAVPSLARAEDLLHKKRSGITKKLAADPSLLSVLSPQLGIVERQLSELQQYHMETLSLRSGLRWREEGEISPGYLKRSIAVRSAKKLIPPLIHPSTDLPCRSKDEMLDAASFFYKELYSPDEVDPMSITTLLNRLPSSLKLSAEESASITCSISYEDILEAFSRSPKTSSPGMDGLPYEIVKLIVEHPSCRKIVTDVYNNALSFSDIPPSWTKSCVSLLPKKQPLENLKNWRPISLINTDAKVFTRILANRLSASSSTLINSHQTGFVRDRFIADNGLLMKLIMDHARLSKSSSIGLLLDQEKAYDRVHPTYLRHVLVRFGYPTSFVDCIEQLFFSTDLHINVNGHISDSVPQFRGLKQGDPISPILFNLAFEPLLRSIQADPQLLGFTLPSSSTASTYPVKRVAYADDIVCLLNSPVELYRLPHHLDLYSKASNALVNMQKPEAISLSGSPSMYSSIWQTPLHNLNIHSWHDC